MPSNDVQLQLFYNAENFLSLWLFSIESRAFMIEANSDVLTSSLNVHTSVRILNGID